MTSSGKRVMPRLLHFSIFSFGCFRKEWASFFFFCLWRVQNSLNPQKKKRKEWWVSECTRCCQHVKFVMEGGRGGGEWLLFIDKQQATTTSFIQTIIYDPFIKNSTSPDLTRGDHGKKKKREQLIHPDGATERREKWETRRMKIGRMSGLCIWVSIYSKWVKTNNRLATFWWET